MYTLGKIKKSSMLISPSKNKHGRASLARADYSDREHEPKKARKEDALALAQLIYEIFVEENVGHTIVKGQTDANPTTYH